MALLLKINKGHYNNIIGQSAKILAKGGIVIYPTETSYAVGADALNPEAVKKVHNAKRQSHGKPVSVIVASLRQAGKIAVIGKTARMLAKKFMPGPLTLVVKKKRGVPGALSKGSIAFRISGNKVATDLCKKFGSAITATSANISGQAPAYSGQKAFEIFSGSADAVIDAGVLPGERASTIFDCRSGKILRAGPVGGKEINSILKKKCMGRGR